MGVCLLVVRRVFKDQIPTVSEYAATHGICADTVHRLYRWLLRPVFRLLRSRRPGPKGHPSDRYDHSAPPTPVLLAANALLKALLPGPVTALLKGSARLRGVVVEQALYWCGRGVTREEIASLLGLPVRTLRRWTRRLKKEGHGQEVPHQSRRPHDSPNQIPTEIQDALWKLRRAFPDLSAAELTRVFNRRCEDLLRSHGLKSISAKTVGRYLHGPRPSPPLPEEPSSKRGEYEYPAPLSMAWMDTTYLEVAGVTIHIAGAMEAGSRIALAAEAFIQDCAKTTIEILERTLSRIPDLAAAVRDRGTPYLNVQVTDFLTSRGILPINAFPYFPIDKAALERWWDTLKSWLRHALKPFEDDCRRLGIVPTKERVVEVVRPALRVFLRAYNLLPQPYHDGQSPIERIDALLRGEGDPDFTLSTLRRAAMGRDDKDDLLQEVKDALQIATPLETMRKDFVGISKDALREALHACHKKLVIERDPTIRLPYRYLLAVARTAERRHQKELDRRTREREYDRQRMHDQAATAAALRQEDEERTLRPENVLHRDVEGWVATFQHPVRAVHRRAENRLTQILAALRLKFGAAAVALIAQARAQAVTLVSGLTSAVDDLPRTLLDRFDALAADRCCGPDPPSTRRSTPPGQPGVTSPSWKPLDNLVRKALGALRKPHVYRTDVSS